MPRWVKWLWITLALLGGLWLAWRLIQLVLIVALALLLTTALAPIKRTLEAQGVPAPWSAYIVFLLLIGAFGVLFGLLIPIILQQAGQLTAMMPDVQGRLSWVAERWEGWRGQYSFLPAFEELSDFMVRQLSATLEGLIGLTGQFVSVAVGLFTLLFLVFFFLKDGRSLLSQVLELLPVRARSEAEAVIARISQRTGRYVLGQLVVMSVDGALTAIGLTLLGLPYAVLLGVLVGLLAIIPLIGPILGALPGVLIGLSISWTTGLWAALIYWGVQQIEGYLIYPFVTGRAVRLHPVWIILAFIAAGSLLGIVGMILAVPVAVTVAILLEELYLPRVNPPPPPEPRSETQAAGP